MALQEKLDRFKKQQEKCHSTLSSIAAKAGCSRAPAPSKPGFVPAPAVTRPPAPAVKFSNDTERLQHINSIRKSPVGAQIKRVIDLLLEVITYLFCLFVSLAFCIMLINNSLVIRMVWMSFGQCDISVWVLHSSILS